MNDVKIGDRLQNGAIVLDVYHDTQGYTRVVAYWENNPFPFVYWTIRRDLSCEYGHYFSSLLKAVSYANERAQLDLAIAREIGRPIAMNTELCNIASSSVLIQTRIKQCKAD